MLLVIVVLLHAGLAIAIKILFFAHGSPVSDKAPSDGGKSSGGGSSPDPMGDHDKSKGGDAMAMMFRA